MERWSWADVWQLRLRRHWLTERANPAALTNVVGDVCGIHAQVAASAELSLGLHVKGITRQHLRAALWQDRTLVKTVGPRSTLHIFPTRELPLWLAALRSRAPMREPNEIQRHALTDTQRDQVIVAIHAALDGRQLTRAELEAEVARSVGDWATEGVFPAFGGQWPRWQLALSKAAADGLLVYGPNRGTRVTYVRTDQWLAPLARVDGDSALKEVCRRFLAAYGPATHVELARWLGTTPAAARELIAQLAVERVDVEGCRAWLLKDEQPPSAQDGTSIKLMPQFDCYVVGCFPRAQLIPECAPAALRKGTAAPFAVVLIDGTVSGIWERTRHGKRLTVRVDTFGRLSNEQQLIVEREAARVGEILELKAEVEFGHVEPRGHL